MEPEKAWSAILNVIRKQIGEASFETWFKHSYVKKEGETWCIISPNIFGSDWLESQYASLIRDTIYEVTNEVPELVFTSEDKKTPFAEDNVQHIVSEIQKLSVVQRNELYEILECNGLFSSYAPDRVKELELEMDKMKSKLSKVMTALEVNN